MRKSVTTLCLALAFLLAACHHAHCAVKDVLASTFPVYLFTANICAGVPGIKVSLLIPAQTGCPHDYAPRPADLQKLAKAKILIINGDGLDAFLTKPLGELRKKPQIINAGANIPVIEYPGEPVGRINPHYFSSPAAAALMARNIGRQMAVLDPPNAFAYCANTAKYVQKLEQLSKRLANIGAIAKNRKIAIEHDALAYLVQNAKLEIVATLENAASAADLGRMRADLLEKKPALLAGDSQYPDKFIRSLSEETGIKSILLNPCASGPEDAPLDYYETVMKENANILQKNLDEAQP